MARFEGNVSHAANALGLSRSALYTGGWIAMACVMDGYRSKRKTRRLTFERRLFLLALAAGLPGADRYRLCSFGQTTIRRGFSGR